MQDYVSNTPIVTPRVNCVTSNLIKPNFQTFISANVTNQDLNPLMKLSKTLNGV